MTRYDQSSLGMTNQTLVPSSLSTNPSPLSVLGQDEDDEQRERPRDLEEERRITAKSITDIILASWPRLYSSTTAASAAQSSLSLPADAQTQSQCAKMNKQRTKVAIQLKQIIASFWSAQSVFQERAQVVLDIFQDPAELESEERVRTLRSRHLNNLLSNPRSPTEGDRLEQKFKVDQEKLVLITEKLQGVWLGTVLLLETPGMSTKSKSSTGTDDSIGTPESFRRKLLRISKSKKQALKK
ncbi:hypothetical protein BGX26_012643 [Mortierella sp. AD094]|nr:hypothetical protein BGX26_012643 [Mortierella sp. AD094]